MSPAMAGATISASTLIWGFTEPRTAETSADSAFMPSWRPAMASAVCSPTARTARMRTVAPSTWMDATA